MARDLPTDPEYGDPLIQVHTRTRHHVVDVQDLNRSVHTLLQEMRASPPGVTGQVCQHVACGSRGNAALLDLLIGGESGFTSEAVATDPTRRLLVYRP